MPRTVASALGQDDTAAPGRMTHCRTRLVFWTILLALALAVFVLRLYRLTEIPPGIFYDEGAHGANALQVLRGEHTVFFPRFSDGLEGLSAYAVALTTTLLGRGVLAIRLPTALASAGTVFAVFWLGRALFGEDENGNTIPWRGLLVGGVAAGLLAFSLSYTIIGRHVFRGNFLPLLLCLSLALLWEGWRQRGLDGGAWWRYAIAGVFLGLVPYTYIASRFVPVLFLLFGLSFLLPFGSGRWQAVRAELPRLGLFLGVTALIAAPILLYFVLHPEHFFLRSRHLWVLDSHYNLGDPTQTVLDNIRLHLLAFGFRGDPHWRHNFGNQPLLNPLEAILFWFGVGTALWRWRRPAYRLLLLWLGVMLLPPMLARDDLVPHYLRMIGAAPAAYLLIGVGVWEILQLLRLRTRALEARTFSIAAAGVIGIALLAQGVLTYRTFFHRWAAIPDLYERYESELTDAAGVLNEQPFTEGTVYMIPYRVDGHPSFEYLYQGAAPAHIVHARSPDLAPKVGTLLGMMEDLVQVKVIDWKEDSSWTGDVDQNFLFLLSKYGRHLGSDEFARFWIHTYTDIALDQPWTFYEHLEPLNVRYDGGIELRGLALGQFLRQMPSKQRLVLEEARSLWVTLQWEATHELTADFAVSIRLYDGDGAMTFQKDAVLGNPDLARTSHWRTGEIVDTLFHLDFPDSLEPGEYELRLIVYDAETLTPTVEIDVWKPEFVLARLRFGRRQ